MRIENKISMESDVELFWNKLIDFENYPKLDLFIKKIEGKKEVGASLIVDIMDTH